MGDAKKMSGSLDIGAHAASVPRPEAHDQCSTEHYLFALSNSLLRLRAHCGMAVAVCRTFPNPFDALMIAGTINSIWGLGEVAPA